MGWSGYIALMQDSGHCDKAGAAGYNETTFQQTAASSSRRACATSATRT